MAAMLRSDTVNGHPFVITSTKYWGASLAKESATKLHGDGDRKVVSF